MFVTVPERLHHALVDAEHGREWLDSISALAARAVERWRLTMGEPFEAGMAAWTAPATTSDGADVVVKISFPHVEARDEGAALAAWHGAGAVEVLGYDADDWALLLRRLRPGSSLRDERLPTTEHLAVGAGLLRRMASVQVPGGPPFRGLDEVADRLATIAEERAGRLLADAPIPADAGLCRHAVELLRSLPAGATHRGLAHGDLNPGNILRTDDGDPGGPADARGWRAIDPKPVYGDLAWDPWPLLTQIGDWTDTVPLAADLADRTRQIADLTGLDASRTAAWCVARGVESGLWAAERGWWTGFLGADGDLARAGAWERATRLLGG